jgi:predicted nucleic-acid-binding Zn-ribbon protein
MKNKTFCPKCKSTDVKKDITVSLAIGMPQNWICNNCGYSNMIFPELGNEEGED